MEVRNQNGPRNYASTITTVHKFQRKLAREENAHEVRAIHGKSTTGIPSPQSKHEYQFLWYLPHHWEGNHRKPDKLCIAPDCAAKHCGRSLNNMLYQGPDTAANLVRIALRLCKERIAISVAVGGMFMQVGAP